MESFFAKRPVILVNEAAREIGVGPALVVGAASRLNIKPHRSRNRRKLLTLEQADRIAAAIINSK